MTVRIALIDSGVNARHPHVREHGSIVLGPTIGEHGELESAREHVDALGHGTAAAAAMLDLARTACVYSIRVFVDRPKCRFENVIVALRHALDERVDLVNLSLGTRETRFDGELLALAQEARERGVVLVSPATQNGLPSRPGALEGWTGVLMDARLPRTAPEQRELDGRTWWFASPYPRDLPGLPRASNLAGPSMAAANLSGFLARERAAR